MREQAHCEFRPNGPFTPRSSKRGTTSAGSLVHATSRTQPAAHDGHRQCQISSPSNDASTKRTIRIRHGHDAAERRPSLESVVARFVYSVLAGPCDWTCSVGCPGFLMRGDRTASGTHSQRGHVEGSNEVAESELEQLCSGGPVCERSCGATGAHRTLDCCPLLEASRILRLSTLRVRARTRPSRTR